jgi:hypothetical protein
MAGFADAVVVRSLHRRTARPRCNSHLTGVLNRRAFIETAQTLCKRQAKRGEPVAVLRAKAPRNAPDSSPQRDEHVRLACRHLRLFRTATDTCGRASHIALSRTETSRLLASGTILACGDHRFTAGMELTRSSLRPMPSGLAPRWPAPIPIQPNSMPR